MLCWFDSPADAAQNANQSGEAFAQRRCDNFAHSERRIERRRRKCRTLSIQSCQRREPNGDAGSCAPHG